MSDDPYRYGAELKSIRFLIADDDHARFLIRLRHHNIKKATHFFRAVMDAVIEEDDIIVPFLEKYVIEHSLLSRKRFSDSLKLKKKGKESLEDFGFLDDAEKEELFDLISKEFPEL
jgi:hypothetical protein